ncbi:hypothetical protein N865_06845 [Intrasporangium oryzae NRRL B-24470]|uniref:AtpZ/AtpI family protein n=1 Tax=Intrasporangium oryzae NRRL B-24470 TaxID=1386089 RepID=W9GBV1_9MICO|nr:AtpZ/AtpI family protein [Intrasporangium oryzae]EWT02303.1 hypothetical protein N865_06845 [Intrasporangium oryzae NRRL B-24470]
MTGTPPPDPTPRPDEPGETPDETPDVKPDVKPDEAEELRRFNSREQDAAWRAVAYMLSGPLIYGGLGALADHWLGTSWLVGVGIVAGMGLSLYLIWFRYGSH